MVGKNKIGYIRTVHVNSVPEHEECDLQLKKWYCSGWVSKSRWIELHGYLPMHHKQEHHKRVN